MRDEEPRDHPQEDDDDREVVHEPRPGAARRLRRIRALGWICLGLAAVSVVASIVVVRHENRRRAIVLERMLITECGDDEPCREDFLVDAARAGLLEPADPELVLVVAGPLAGVGVLLLAIRGEVKDRPTLPRRIRIDRVGLASSRPDPNPGRTSMADQNDPSPTSSSSDRLTGANAPAAKSSAAAHEDALSPTKAMRDSLGASAGERVGDGTPNGPVTSPTTAREDDDRARTAEGTS